MVVALIPTRQLRLRRTTSGAQAFARITAVSPLLAGACAVAVAAPPAGTPSADARRGDAHTLATVHVVARAATTDLDTPAAVTVIDAGIIARSGPQVDATEILARVPGVVAYNRWNYAQDLQLSMRGYGARANFGVRGIRLYVNGIPASAADGQGQLAHAALASAERIEVLRGPLAALYGHAAGGVIKIDSDPRVGWPGVEALAWRGAGVERDGLVLRGGHGPFAAVLDLGRFATDGFRPHSRARRDTLDAHALLELAPRWRLAVAANQLDAPRALDPQGLSPAEFVANPRQTSPNARAFNTRKSVSQRQLGAALTRVADDRYAGSLAVWTGMREVEQFLAVPVAAQANPLSGGGAIAVTRDFAGLQARVSRRLTGLLAPLRVTVGYDVETLDEARLGFENFVGATLGLRGARRRDEINRVDARDGLVQAEWRLDRRGLLFAGWRHSRLAYRSNDRFVNATNPDDSGMRRFRADVPALGLRWRLGHGVSLHASAARAFEAPTVNELSYRSDGTAGLNLDLRPTRADRREIGLRWRRDDVTADLVWFRDCTADEIVVARSVGGRTSFRNAGRTLRAGAELALRLRLTEQLVAEAAWTAIDARLRDRVSGAVVAGNRLPGVPPAYGQAELVWQPAADWLAVATMRSVGGQYADDANRVRVPRGAVLDLLVRRAFELGGGTLDLSVRAENLFDRDHVAAVIVNEASGRVFEPAPGRRVLLGLAWRW